MIAKIDHITQIILLILLILAQTSVIITYFVEFCSIVSIQLFMRPLVGSKKDKNSIVIIILRFIFVLNFFVDE